MTLEDCWKANTTGEEGWEELNSQGQSWTVMSREVIGEDDM